MHRFRPSRGLTALESLLALATLVAPARAATYRADIVTNITDPKGDVTDEDDDPLTEARADVTAASVEYRPGEIAFTLNVAQPSDPAPTPTGRRRLLRPVALDTNADQDPDYIITLVSVNGLADGTVAIGGAPDGDHFAGPITVAVPLGPGAGGYWLVGDDGGIFSFGDAQFWGSTGSMTLAQPIVGMASSGTGGGYWFVASDGGIFGFAMPGLRRRLHWPSP